MSAEATAGATAVSIRPDASTGARRRAVLLLNVGSPVAPTTQAVRVYLREFLSDARVLDLPAPARIVLAKGIIAPLRAPRSAGRYREIWTEAGSPLLVHTRELAAALAQRLPTATIAYAMRYGVPSIAEELARLRAHSCSDLLIAPLYPQYASASTGSAVEAVYHELRKQSFMPAVSVLAPFFDRPEYLDAVLVRVRESLRDFPAEHLLFSYHGVPWRHVRAATAFSGHACGSAQCCANLSPPNYPCYRAQCFATTRLLAARLPLPSSTAFQSRFGAARWIDPYAEEEIKALAGKGVRKLLVACPSFVADCLETLEEIGLRAQEVFAAAGGTELRLVPSLNAHPMWADGLAAMIARALPP